MDPVNCGLEIVADVQLIIKLIAWAIEILTKCWIVIMYLESGGRRLYSSV